MKPGGDWIHQQQFCPIRAAPCLTLNPELSCHVVVFFLDKTNVETLNRSVLLEYNLVHNEHISDHISLTLSCTHFRYLDIKSRTVCNLLLLLQQKTKCGTVLIKDTIDSIWISLTLTYTVLTLLRLFISLCSDAGRRRIKPAPFLKQSEIITATQTPLHSVDPTHQTLQSFSMKRFSDLCSSLWQSQLDKCEGNKGSGASTAMAEKQRKRKI